jgi:hypothetical protein
VRRHHHFHYHARRQDCGGWARRDFEEATRSFVEGVTRDATAWVSALPDMLGDLVDWIVPDPDEKDAPAAPFPEDDR